MSYSGSAITMTTRGRWSSEKRNSCPQEINAEKIDAGDRRAPMLFDVLDDQVGPGEMADERGRARVVHRVGHVAHQHDVKALVDELPDGERPAEHAHVGVHAHHDHVLDAPLLHQVDGLGAVGDGVGRLDLQGRDLARPRAPLLAGRIAIAAAVGVVDRQMAFALAIEVAALLSGTFVATCGAAREPVRAAAVPS